MGITDEVIVRTAALQFGAFTRVSCAQRLATGPDRTRRFGTSHRGVIWVTCGGDLRLRCHCVAVVVSSRAVYI